MGTSDVLTIVEVHFYVDIVIIRYGTARAPYFTSNLTIRDGVLRLGYAHRQLITLQRLFLPIPIYIRTFKIVDIVTGRRMVDVGDRQGVGLLPPANIKIRIAYFPAV